jgi:methionyl-tRNA synthetase
MSEEEADKSNIEKEAAAALASLHLAADHADDKKILSSPASSSSYDRWTLLDDAALDYGYLSSTTHAIDGEKEDDSASAAGGNSGGSTFYITTAINYTNGPAHMGHAYEAATSDVIARYQRLTGHHDAGGVFFLTGSDEHGQKIANTAADQNQTPQDICDLYVTGFKVLNQRIRITNNDYLRTTSDRHKRTARELWNRCAAAGDIYLDTYSGWYNVREETFVTDSDALLSNYLDPTSGLPLKKVEEESYFFKMSKYKDQLLQYIEVDNPTFIQPEHHKNLILQRLKSDDLRDLSISRTTFSWGIAVPDNFAPNHVMYVWVDALSNYLTGVNGLLQDIDDADGQTAINKGLQKFWPADVHIIGKDILWFHTVIWPCLLMSANLPLPKAVFAHGFVNDKEGKKMSKSLGNVVDPHDMLDKFHVDSFRWYLAKEAAFGGELAFSEDSMRDMHNADLCDNIGNLVNRAANLCLKYCNGVIPDVWLSTDDQPVDLMHVLESYKTKMNAYDLQGGATVAIRAFSNVNGWLQVKEPWNLKGDEHAHARQVTVKHVLEAIYALSHLLLPFVPTGAKAIFGKLHTPPVSLQELQQKVSSSSTEGGLLAVGTTIEIGQVLYEKSLSDEDRNKGTSATAASSKKKDSFAEAKRKKDEAKAKALAASQKGEACGGDGGGDANQPDFTKLEIRVGKIVKVWNHEKADKLYCEQIDLGELGGGVREIASGLRPYYSLEEMQDKLVLVVCNLKAQKLVGFESNGMVLAAKSADGSQVELVLAPDGAVLGERVLLQGLDGGTEAEYPPFSSTQVRKKKIFEAVAADLKTSDDDDCKATWKGQVLTTSAGPCKANTLKGASIS